MSVSQSRTHVCVYCCVLFEKLKKFDREEFLLAICCSIPKSHDKNIFLKRKNEAYEENLSCYTFSTSGSEMQLHAHY